MDDLIRVKHCLQMFRQCQELEGSVAECGAGFGQTTFLLDRLVKDAGKVLYAFDTFKGLPYDDSIDSKNKCLQGEMNFGNQFYDIFNELTKTSILVVPGLIEETLPEFFEDEKFCFAWIDLDLYQPTSFTYKFFEDRVVDNGIIGFHDYNFHRCPGIKKVVDEEVNFDKFEKILNEDTCYFIKKKA